eukprot:gb/GFBE01056136.1/.p1 GENE.gb/GFBE01056136.1/~~gb/GFBE01056136.1/.p1  ORF type:complete len:545 (+),score=107.29 gb/GFBE01056136.1/:1-1635(+)
MMADWQDVAALTSVSEWLDAKGLGKHAPKIIEATDAESVDDLKLIDQAMLEEVIVAADLKLVSAKKFRMAIAELRGEQCDETDTPQSAAAESSYDNHLASAALSQPEPVPVQERVVICIDRSGSMRSPFQEITLNVVRGETKDSVSQRTRMEAVKAMFYAFRDRIESLGSPGSHELGLLQFDNSVGEMLELTCQLDRFESIVDDIQPRGQTAIYSSIAEAARMLEKHFDKESGTDLRIVVLTDGQNNTGIPPQEALQAVNRIGATVDAIIVGDSPDANLRRIVTATEGECYQISNLGEGFELLEAEGVASLRARRGGAEKAPFRERDMVDFGTIAEKSMTQGSAVQRASAASTAFANKAVADVTRISDAAATGSLSGAAAKRALTEIRQIATQADRPEGVHVFPSPDSINLWRALVEGPQDSPFRGGVFVLNVEIPDGYPFQPPRITFDTPVYHCNVSDSGKICLPVLQESWNPSLTVAKALAAIRWMLQEPNTDDSLRQWIAELTIAHRKSNGADTRYAEKAAESTQQHASASVDEWKQRWGC